MYDAYTKEYFTWRGVRDEMCLLKKSYGDRGVPKDLWDKLEGICKQALEEMVRPPKTKPGDKNFTKVSLNPDHLGN